MATATVQTIVRQIKKLSRGEQQELRTVLDALLASAPSLTEEEFHRGLAAEGRICPPSPEVRAHPVRGSFKPVPVKGKSVSETVTEERR